MTDASMSGEQSPKLLSVEFLTLCLILAAAFCNVSVFYSFYHYLGMIGIPDVWRGFLVGLEPMSAFVLRFFLFPWVHARNAIYVLIASLIILIIVSCAYLFAVTIPALFILRIIHGGVIVLLTSAAVTLAVCFIPKEKSGQGFSILSVTTLIPFAVMPPLNEALLPYLRSEADVYAGVSVFAGLSIMLLLASQRRLAGAMAGMSGVPMQRPTLAEIRENLRLRDVSLMLFISLLVFLAHAAFFFFMKTLSLRTGAGDVGLFFMISMSAMILVRLLSGSMLDRANKRSLLMSALALLVLFFCLIPNVGHSAVFYVLAILYGLCVGISLPLINALLFSVSPGAFRGLNANLNLLAMDTAYFLMPYAGGLMVAFGTGVDAIFYAGAVAIAMAVILAMFVSAKS